MKLDLKKSNAKIQRFLIFYFKTKDDFQDVITKIEKRMDNIKEIVGKGEDCISLVEKEN